EIEKIKKACEIGDKVYSQTLKKIRIGVSEKELAKEIVRLIRTEGASLSFRPIVAFGKNAYEIHHKANDTKLRKNHGFIKLDLGAKFEGYCSDMTRTVFFGKATEKQKKIYGTVLEAQKKAMSLVKDGRRAFDADKIARDYIKAQGFPLYPHTLGHGIGKKVHEGFRLGPKSKTILRNGMVFTIEPGIYLKGFGGVRIEDTFLLKNGKLESLTKSSKILIEL
ncbi:MAG: M24 family metallopeptidase, partial [Patescibacteria group bacterium]